jgi:hypothetical protein
MIGGHWTGDAHGNKDYYVPVLTLAARYSPPTAAEPRARVRCYLVLRRQTAAGERQELVLDEATFEAETFARIREEFDAWAQERLDRVARALAMEFDIRGGR